ncbi:hypothetical protein H8958_022175 [Nasalis larvatus]
MGTSGTLLGSARQVGWHAALLLWPRLWDLLVDIWLTAAQRRKVTAFHGSLDIGCCPPASCPQCPPWVFRKLISFQPSQLGRTNMHYSKLPRTAVETEFKQNVGPPPKDLTTEVYFPSIKFRSDLPVVFYSQYFKHPICVGEYGPKNGAEREIEEQKILPTTMMFSRLADCALKSTQIPILGVAM